MLRRNGNDTVIELDIDPNEFKEVDLNDTPLNQQDENSTITIIDFSDNSPNDTPLIPNEQATETKPWYKRWFSGWFKKKEEIDETTPLFADQPQQANTEPGFFAKTGKITAKFLLYLLSVAGSLPSALNAYSLGSGTLLKNISLNDFLKLKASRKVLGLTFFLSSAVTNTIMNSIFLPEAWKKLTSDIKDWKSAIKDPFTYAAILMAIAAGIGNGAIAYDAFAFLGSTGSLIGFGLTFLVITTSRYRGVHNTIKAIKLAFNKKFKLQKNIAENLRHINPENLNEIRRKLSTVLKSNVGDEISDEKLNSLTKEQKEKILTDTIDVLTQIKSTNPHLFLNITCAQKFGRGVGSTFDVTLAFVLGASGYLLFTEKGVLGLSKFFAAIKDLPRPAKIAIGTPSGLAGGMTYFSAALQLRDTIYNIFKVVLTQPDSKGQLAWEISKAITIAAFAMVSATGPEHIYEDFVKNKENIYNIQDPWLKFILILIGTMAGAVMNTQTAFQKTHGSRFNIKRPEEVIAKLLNNCGDAKDLMSDRVYENLVNNSIFAKAKPEPTEKEDIILSFQNN